MHGGHVYGGFVRSHLSGKPWRDLDIALDISANEMSQAISDMAAFLVFVLDLAPADVDATITHQTAYSTITGVFTVLRKPAPIVLSVDVSPVKHSRPRMLRFAPATLGSSLSLKKGVVAFRDAPASHIRLCDLVALLEQGVDVETPNGSRSAGYGRWFWHRIERSKAAGWTHRASLRNYPPRP